MLLISFVYFGRSNCRVMTCLVYVVFDSMTWVFSSFALYLCIYLLCRKHRMFVGNAPWLHRFYRNQMAFFFFHGRCECVFSKTSPTITNVPNCISLCICGRYHDGRYFCRSRLLPVWFRTFRLHLCMVKRWRKKTMCCCCLWSTRMPRQWGTVDRNRARQWRYRQIPA